MRKLKGRKSENPNAVCRIVGGLLGAHLLARRAGADVEPGWPCEGPLLRLAEDVATRQVTSRYFYLRQCRKV